MGAAVLAGLVALVVWLHNRLVRARVRVEEAWAQVATDLQRRHDLIPNLVGTVANYAAHETAALEEVTRARAAALTASGPDDRRRAEDALTEALRQLTVRAEAYPQLRADERYAALQDELTGTEDRLAFGRDFAIARTAAYHELLGSFPWLVVARAFRFRRCPSFAVDLPTVRDAPTLGLGS
ncbi:LemA family protein [Nitriliruptoraceae bacterium ZYF776]|nr:LemA family protein [Profundirhabdus halotolerans]